MLLAKGYLLKLFISFVEPIVRLNDYGFKTDAELENFSETRSYINKLFLKTPHFANTE